MRSSLRGSDSERLPVGVVLARARWLRLRQWWCVLEEEDEAEVEEEEEI